ncbi:hypothetical protein D3C81_1695740 [compost metagenome]
MDQGLAQIEVIGVVGAFQHFGGQCIQAARAVDVIGIDQTLLRLAEQQFGFLAAHGLRALMRTVGEFGHAAFQQRAALAQAKHFIAQHAVGGGGILQAAGVVALVAAQGFHAVAQRAYFLGGVVAGQSALLLPGLPGTPAEPAGRAQRTEHDQRQHPAQWAAVRWSGGDVIHGSTASLAGRPTTWGL